jgi:hypothetical protein
VSTDFQAEDKPEWAKGYAADYLVAPLQTHAQHWHPLPVTGLESATHADESCPASKPRSLVWIS